MEAFTQNSKTILSIDFDRESTCGQICPYCYVNNMIRIYPSYGEKIKRNAKWAKENGKDFAETLNKEYRKLENSRSKSVKRLKKLPVRIYGAGDFIPEHSWFLIELDFKFYIISKNLTRPDTKFYIERLLTLENLTAICLSFDNNNIENYAGVSGYLNKDRIKFSYTGTADDFIAKRKQGYLFNIFFNIKKTKEEKEKSQKLSEACPCDSGKIKHAESCSYCNKCWNSSIW